MNESCELVELQSAVELEEGRADSERSQGSVSDSSQNTKSKIAVHLAEKEAIYLNWMLGRAGLPMRLEDMKPRAGRRKGRPPLS